MLTARVVKWVLSWSTLLGIAAAQSTQEPSPPDPRLGDAAEKEADARLVRIRGEFGKPGADRGWAGRYYRGDGTGVNVTVELAPAAGFVFRWDGCLGLYDRNYGTLVEKDGRLELTFVFPNATGGFRGLAPVLVPVAWGERRYLLASDELRAFASAVNGGLEPRTGVHGRFLLRSGDEARPVQGTPGLPKEIAGLLLAKPVAGTIVAVHGSKIETRDQLAWRVSEVTVDRGAQDGLWPGLAVYVHARQVLFADVTVVEVGEHTARVRIRDWSGEKAAVPEVGWEWSTRLASK